MVEFKDFQSSEAEQFQSWRKNRVSSYKEICLKQIEKCRDEGSKQMAGGGQFFQKTEQGFLPVTLFDQRKIYIQSVLTLHDLMLRYFDKQAKDDLKKLNEEIQTRRKQAIELYCKLETRLDLRQYAQQTGEITASKIGSKILSSFENFVYSQHRRMFQGLLLLFDRKNELSNKKSVSIF